MARKRKCRKTKGQVSRKSVAFVHSAAFTCSPKDKISSTPPSSHAMDSIVHAQVPPLTFKGNILLLCIQQERLDLLLILQMASLMIKFLSKSYQLLFIWKETKFLDCADIYSNLLTLTNYRLHSNRTLLFCLFGKGAPDQRVET